MRYPLEFPVMEYDHLVLVLASSFSRLESRLGGPPEQVGRLSFGRGTARLMFEV